MSNKMLPNGGFPPISPCIEKVQMTEEKDTAKGFFYSTKTNNLNIRNILNKTKSKSKFIETREEEDVIEVIDSV